METEQLLEITETIFDTPTAPFREVAMREAVRGLLAGCAGVELEEDAFGNLIARYSPAGREVGWCFGAHMDHPGFVAMPEDPGALELEPHRLRDGYYFLGGVPERYLSKAPPVREFDGFAMWDLPAFERAGTQVHGRACDDLIGCAAIVALLTDLSARGVEAGVAAVFTRAEEVGFVGAYEFGKVWPFPQRACFVSLETSIPVEPGAKMGGGAMVRVGDRLSVFDHGATADLMAAAEARSIPVQRALLDRGACEATALQAFGVRTAGISVPLGNYHNCAPDDEIAAEFVELSDFESMLALITALAETCPDGPRQERGDLLARMEKRAAAHAAFV